MKFSPLPFVILRAPIRSFRDPHSEKAHDAVFEEGLYLASRELWEQQQREAAAGHANSKLALALRRYRIRSAHRCTPFGTFAGCTVLSADPATTRVELAEPAAHFRHTRLDNSCVWEIAQALQSWPGVADQLLFYPNNTLYTFGDTHRYVEYVPEKDTRKHRISAIARTPATALTFATTKDGCRLEQLRLALSREQFGTAEEVGVFIEALIEAQVLRSGLEPAVTGEDPLRQLMKTCAGLDGIGPVRDLLGQIVACLDEPHPGTRYLRDVDALLRELQDLFKTREISMQLPRHTLHTDLVLKTAHASFSEPLARAVTASVEKLAVLSRVNRNPALDTFRKQFLARFDGAEVPLSIALDPESGVGYGTVGEIRPSEDPLLDGLAAPPAHGFPRHDAFTLLAQQKYHEWLRGSSPGIELLEEDLVPFREDAAKLRFPASMYIMGSLYGRNAPPDPSSFLFSLSAFSGPSAATLTGRFAGGDERLAVLLRETLRAEEAADPGAVFAEIAHLPQTRTANILQRPLLRRYEIAWAGNSAADPEHTIFADDLLVSIRDGVIVLRSIRLNKRVVPRLSSAHNYAGRGLPLYRFLCDLQYEQLARPVLWSWGARSGERRLPRVSFENIVLHKATWQFNASDFKTLPDAASEQAAWFQTFREQQALPESISLCDGDNTLVLNTQVAEDRALLLHYLRRWGSVRLEEILQTADNAFVRNAAGEPFGNEIILPLRVQSTPTAVPLPVHPGTAQRRFPPGSPWVYVKVYCGQSVAEKLLVRVVLPFVESAMRQGSIEGFFFIRYRDEFPHLRIRFLAACPEKRTRLQEAFLGLLASWVEDGVIHSLSVDTYERELERYGAERIATAEDLFRTDSIACLGMLRLLSQVEDSDRYRILLALRSLDSLLNDFDCALPLKLRIMQGLAESFAREHGAHPSLQKALNEKYRRLQREIFRHMDPCNDHQNGIQEAVEVIHERSALNRSLLAAAGISLQEGADPQQHRFVTSLLHMLVNRFFPARQRSYELLLYHFLWKYYGSQIALQTRSGLTLHSTPIS